MNNVGGADTLRYEWPDACNWPPGSKRTFHASSESGQCAVPEDSPETSTQSAASSIDLAFNAPSTALLKKSVPSFGNGTVTPFKCLNIGKSTTLTPNITLSISVVRSARALKFPVPPNK